MQLLNLKAFSKLFPTLPMCKHGVRIYAYHKNSIEPFCFKHVKCLDFRNIKTLLHCFIVNTGFFRRKYRHQYYLLCNKGEDNAGIIKGWSQKTAKRFADFKDFSLAINVTSFPSEEV